MYTAIFILSLIAILSFSIVYMVIASNLTRLKHLCCQRQEVCNVCRQDTNVWTISGRRTTEDCRISIESYVFPPEYSAKDTSCPPPPYTEVDLPTYDEAIQALKSQETPAPSSPL